MIGGKQAASCPVYPCEDKFTVDNNDDYCDL